MNEQWGTCIYMTPAGSCRIQEVWRAKSITLELCHSIYLAISTSADWISLQMNAAWPVYASCWYSCWCWWGALAWQWCQLLTKDHLRGHTSGTDCIIVVRLGNDIIKKYKMSIINRVQSSMAEIILWRRGVTKINCEGAPIVPILFAGMGMIFQWFFINTLCIK